MKITASLLLCAALSSAAVAQTDDFNDLNDTGWTRYTPLTAFGGTASFAFTGGVYRIASSPSPDEGQLGPSRAGSLRQDVRYTSFCICVDLVDWDPAEDTSMGILARVQPSPGIGTTSGYAFTYQGKDQDVQLSRVDGEAPTSLSGSPSLTLTPGGSYRMIFFGAGNHLEGRIYDLNDLLTPLIIATGTDATYAEGTCGLVVFADENTRASAGFDNYRANNGSTSPPALTIVDNPAVAGQDLEVTWAAATSLCHTLESSTDLQLWTSHHAQNVTAGRFHYKEPFDNLSRPSVFFRLRLGPSVILGIAPQ